MDKEQRQTMKIYEHTETVMDSNSGEISEQKRYTKKLLPVEPAFVKMYLKDILLLKDVPKGLHGVLYALIMRINYYNEVVVNSELKRKIAEEVGLSFTRVNQGVTAFVKKGILIRTGKGIYVINPHLFGRGSWENIQGIRLQVGYKVGSADREIEATIETTDDHE
jgi:hypothetical protein